MPQALKGVKNSFCVFCTLCISMMNDRSTRELALQECDESYWSCVIWRVRNATFQKMIQHSDVCLEERYVQIFCSFSEGSNENIFALLLVYPMGILKHPTAFRRRVLGLSVTDSHAKRWFLNNNNSIILFSWCLWNSLLSKSMHVKKIWRIFPIKMNKAYELQIKVLVRKDQFTCKKFPRVTYQA